MIRAGPTRWAETANNTAVKRREFERVIEGMDVTLCLDAFEDGLDGRRTEVGGGALCNDDTLGEFA